MPAREVAETDRNFVTENSIAVDSRVTLFVATTAYPITNRSKGRQVSIRKMKKGYMRALYWIVLVFALFGLDLETTGATATTGAFELSSLRSYVRLDSVVGVGVVDSDSVSEVSKGFTGLRSTKQDGVASLR